MSEVEIAKLINETDDNDMFESLVGIKRNTLLLACKPQASDYLLNSCSKDLRNLYTTARRITEDDDPEEMLSVISEIEDVCYEAEDLIDKSMDDRYALNEKIDELEEYCEELEGVIRYLLLNPEYRTWCVEEIKEFIDNRDIKDIIE